LAGKFGRVERNGRTNPFDRKGYGIGRAEESSSNRELDAKPRWRLANPGGGGQKVHSEKGVSQKKKKKKRKKKGDESRQHLKGGKEKLFSDVRALDLT